MNTETSTASSDPLLKPSFHYFLKGLGCYNCFCPECAPTWASATPQHEFCPVFNCSPYKCGHLTEMQPMEVLYPLNHTIGLGVTCDPSHLITLPGPFCRSYLGRLLFGAPQPAESESGDGCSLVRVTHEARQEQESPSSILGLVPAALPPHGPRVLPSSVIGHWPFLLKQVRGGFHHQGSMTHPFHRPTLNTTGVRPASAAGDSQEEEMGPKQPTHKPHQGLGREG